MCHFLGQVLGCARTICSYGQISISCTFHSGSPCRPSRVLPNTPSVLICCIRFLCDWSFRFCHRIAYIYCFVASYLFSLSSDWSLCLCPVVLFRFSLKVSFSWPGSGFLVWDVYYYYYYYYSIIERRLGLWDTNRSPNPGQKNISSDGQQKKKKTCQIENFDVPSDHWMKVKENEKRNKCLELARELNYYVTWVMVIPIVNSALGMIPQKWAGKTGNRRTNRDYPNYSIVKIRLYTEKVLETWRDCCHSNSCERSLDNVSLKNYQGRIIIIIIPFRLITIYSVLADGLSLEVEWQQVSSCFQDSSQYSCRSQ